jgi:hypothetical protein
MAAKGGLSRETVAQLRSQRRGIPYLQMCRALRSCGRSPYLEGYRVAISHPPEWNQE